MTTFFRNVRLLDLNQPGGTSLPCDLRVAAGRIHEIAPSLAVLASDEVLDGGGNLLMPGLVNGHFHSSVNHMKGRLPDTGRRDVAAGRDERGVFLQGCQDGSG